MGFWSRFWETPVGVIPNSNDPGAAPQSVGGTAYTPGNPDGVELTNWDAETEHRSLQYPQPSGWDGWPGEWATPQWDFGSRFNELVDVAWGCLDLNTSILSTMPVYRTRGPDVIDPTAWMSNPDPSIYSSWHEFAKQLFWDFQLGEAFVMAMTRYSDGFPMTFRVVPPYLMHVDTERGSRRYKLGGSAGVDVTDDILHIRYKSTTDGAHGVGPLESAGGRMLTAGVIAQYVRTVVSTGGIPLYTLETEQWLEEGDAQALLNQWMAARAKNLGAPPILDQGVKLNAVQGVSPRDMAMIELAQFTEGRIANLLGVPPFLVGLPSGGDSMTYSNVSSLFDFHDRASLKTKAVHVMAALSNWALPAGQSAELNRDEYTRPPFADRAQAWATLIDAGVVTVDEVRQAERLNGSTATAALSGAET